ncbi:MAG: PBP1A family penicillin-binding protein [Gemmatimonadaceae bacterium]|nr:PBP1A family penicillin-binding protein [Gemmatimonadaceae bacterium]
MPLRHSLAFIALLAATLATPLRAQGASEAWQIVPQPQASLVLARDGELIGELGTQLRVSVSIKTLPPFVGQALIAVEDQRFYKHDGVDVVGLAAAFKDALRGHARGASTITQQLVGNMHPDLIDRADRSISRKIHEQNAAREMERHYDKQQILEAYLNQIHFGHGWYGIEEASRHYFGIPAARLSLAQAATLAALPKGPAIYDPVRHPDRARERRDLVLTLMAEQGYASPTEAAAAKGEPIVTAPSMGTSPAPYVVDVVRREAEADGVPVMSGGFQITTTIDAHLQSLAADALASGLTRAEARAGYKHPKFATRAPGSSDYLQGAVVALDPENGNVLALVGGRSFADSHFDRALNALRQPGSAFKPIVYAAALADTLTASSIVYDTALTIPLDRNGVYRPRNDDGQFLGPLTLREALTRSRNPVAVQLGMAEGMDTIASLAHALGITTPIAPYPSSAIGASAVRPLDLVAAYAAFDNDGSSVTPRFIRRIADASGRAVYAERAAARDSVLDPRVAFIVRDMMRDVVARGTATSVRRYVPERIEVAGKTGTTNNDTDAWFVGMTPELVAGVWVGFDKPVPIAPGAAGGSIAAPIWGDMIGRYYQATSSGEWNLPAGLVAMDFDRDKLAPADSTTLPERRYTEYFLDGTQPGDPWALFANGPITF